MSKKTSLNKALFLSVIGVVLIIGGWVLMTQTKHTAPELPQAIEDAASATGAEATPGEKTLMAAASPAPDIAVPAATTTTETPAAVSTKPTPVLQPEGRFLGKKDAPVQMIEFSSLTCSHCAHFHNEILDEFRVKYVDTGLVRIEFRDFPLNKPALDAAMILHCLPEKQFFAFMSMLFQTQDHWAFSNDYLTSIKQNAKLAGLSDAAFDACLNDQAATQKLATTIKADAEKYKVESTPTFIINGGKSRVVGAMPVDDFAKEIDPLLPPSTKK